MVAQVAAKVGVSDPNILKFVEEEISSHMPGGKCQGGGQDQYNPGAANDGVPEGDYKKGFLNKVWRFVVEPDSRKGDTLYGTMVKIDNLPKQFADQDDEIVDQDVQVTFKSTTDAFEDQHGDPIDMKALAKADRVWVKAKLAPPEAWQNDEDNRPVPTLRGRRAAIIK